MKGQGDKCDSRRCRRRKPVTGRVTPAQATLHQEAFGPLGSQELLLRSQRMNRNGLDNSKNSGHGKKKRKKTELRLKRRKKKTEIKWKKRPKKERRKRRGTQRGRSRLLLLSREHGGW